MRKLKGYKRDFAQAVRDMIVEDQEDTEPVIEEEKTSSEEELIEDDSTTMSLAAEDIKKRVDAQVQEELGSETQKELTDDASADLTEELSEVTPFATEGMIDNIEADYEVMTKRGSLSNDLDELTDGQEEPENISNKGAAENMENLEHELKREEELTVGFSENTTYITKNTTITGDVDIDGDIEILGRVDGNVKCTGKLLVGGRVDGDITTGDLYADNAHIEGKVTSDGLVRVGAGSVLIGNIAASSAKISGAVKGDIDVKGDVEIGSTAVIVGNIKSKSVQVSSGAVVEGMCQQVYSNVDVSQYFEEGIQNLDDRA